MLRGVVSTAAPADVYAMIMGSLNDGQIRHNPDYIDEAKVQSEFNNVSSNIISYRIPRHC